MRAQVVYLPMRRTNPLGHISVRLFVSEEEINEVLSKWPWFKEVLGFKVGLDQPGGASGNYIACLYQGHSFYKSPTIIKRDKNYSVYGYKEGFWQETSLKNLSAAELACLDKLHEKYEHSSELIDNEILLNIVKKGHPSIPQTEFFCDFGGTFDLQQNRKNRGDVEPIFIDLPEIKADFAVFCDRAERAGLIHKDSPRYQYNLLTNNCAHGTLHILHLLGYLKEKPKQTFALLPFSVALQACDIANRSQIDFRNDVINSLKKNAEKKEDQQYINKLIADSLMRVNNKINFGGLINKKTLLKDQKLLSGLKYDGSRDSIEQMIEASTNASNVTRAELEECLNNVPANIYLETCIERLNKIAKQLEKKDPNDAKEIYKLSADFKNNYDALKQKSISYQAFYEKSINRLEKARPILARHRDTKQLINNLVLAILGLGVLYLAAICVNKAIRGNFLFFNDTPLILEERRIKNAMLRVKH